MKKRIIYCIITISIIVVVDVDILNKINSKNNSLMLENVTEIVEEVKTYQQHLYQKGI